MGPFKSPDRLTIRARESTASNYESSGAKSGEYDSSNFQTEGKLIHLMDNNKNSVILEDSKEYEESKMFNE